MHSFIRFSPSTITFLYSLLAGITGARSCTNGRLFVADANSSSIFYFDLDGGLEALAPSGSLLDDLAGVEGQTVISAGENEIAVIHRGLISSMYEDGSIHFYRAGTVIESHGDHDHVEKRSPFEIQNAKVNCARATHYVEHDDKIAIFCDGFFNPDLSGTQVNTTVHVVDKTLFASAPEPSAVVHSVVLEGSHHGVAVPVDDNHLLVSVALPERIARVEDSSSLPNGFVVQDYEGNLLHDLNVADDKDRSCAGYHGTAAINGNIAMGCDATHGGILLVDYEPTTAAYTSRSLVYPEGFEGYRVGSFLEHHHAKHVMANFNGNGTFNMLAFDPTFESFSEEHLLTFPERPCSSAYEKTEAEVIFVFLATGVFQVYEFHNTWKLLSEVEVIPGMTDCATGFMTPGYGQAFVFDRVEEKMHAIDATELLHSLHDETVATTLTDATTLTVFETSLTFMPSSAAVSGVPEGYACVAEEHHDHPAEPEPAPVDAPSEPVDAPTAPAETPSAPVGAPVETPVSTENDVPTEGSAGNVVGGSALLVLSVLAMVI